MNVALIIYKRPELTEKVFARIAQARPQKLFLIADGAKDEKEVELCMRTRAMVEKVDWPCEVFKNYADKNMGCRRRTSSGVSWVFDHVEEAIIFDDDCVPDLSFFPFCSELLERYRSDTRVMHISGNNFQKGIRRSSYSYYFSAYAHSWGWATWRRAWKLYDAEMTFWPAFKRMRGLEQIFRRKKEIVFWERWMESVYRKQMDSWSSVWTFSVWVHSGLAILPEINLVSNIGYGRDSTHTVDAKSPLANMATGEIGTIEHPLFMVRDLGADEFTFLNAFYNAKYHSPWQQVKGCLCNRYWYGSVLRRIPVLHGLLASCDNTEVPREEDSGK